MKNKKWLGAGLVVALIAVFALIFVNFSEKPVEGSKEISIEVINQAEESELYELKTDAEFLRQAMEEAEGLEFSGQESEYGLMVEVVNGESALGTSLLLPLRITGLPALIALTIPSSDGPA